MHKDSMRDKLGFEMYCSKHPTERLTFSYELSAVVANSAYEANVKIVVHPCKQCQDEVENIRSAVNTLFSFQNQIKS